MNWALSTTRLLLTPFEREDIDLFYEINTHPFVRQYLWDNQVIPHEVALDILRENKRHFEEENWGLWKIMDNQKQVMGYVGLWIFFEKQPQLIYALLPEYAGHGFATEAAAEMIHYSFTQLHYDHLIACTDPPNQASIRVCKRLGMDLVDDKLMDGKRTLFFRIENT